MFVMLTMLMKLLSVVDWIDSRFGSARNSRSLSVVFLLPLLWLHPILLLTWQEKTNCFRMCFFGQELLSSHLLHF